MSYATPELLRAHLAEPSSNQPGTMLRQLIKVGMDRLPLPGHGDTLARWQCLAAVAAHDLSLAKLYEGHTDALAIIAELGGIDPPSLSRWAVWAAEPPNARLELRRESTSISLHGRKAWCSGAAGVTYALVTCWEAHEAITDGPLLAAVAIAPPLVKVTSNGWHAVGMSASASVEVEFNGASATVIGRAGDYLRRPGFWHGGAGIAACWYGGALGLAEVLRERVAKRSEPHAAAHLGAVDSTLSQCAALLRETATAIDGQPSADAQRWAMLARSGAERAATEVLDHVGRALGAGPFCLDSAFARRAADLPVFLRQSHAERDLEVLGSLVATQAVSSWTL